MKIYINTDYKCYTLPYENLKTIETDAFDGKCPAYIEGYRYVPPSERWVREDGVMFQGEMIAPWKPWEELDAAQRVYEQEQLEEANIQNDQMLETIAVMVDEVYQSDIETLGI